MSVGTRTTPDRPQDIALPLQDAADLDPL
ncbi:MAG: hypothetical protein AVDCRST_MAG32-3081, partial [uncultured Nocardioides sp.]